jgi:hypothetical protein
MNRLLLLLATITLAGCVRPGDHPISPNCIWDEQDNRSLQLTRISDRRHLRSDAETAEDMAIRWADVHFHLLPEWNQKCSECMEKLFQGIAAHHGVDVALVRQYSRERDPVVDTAVIVSFGILYLLVVYIVAGRLRRRFPSGDDNASFWIMSLVMAAGVSLVAVVAGILGSIVIEGIRLNSGHLSFRMNRIPFRHHWLILLVCGFVIFGLVALMRFRDKLRMSR